MILNANDFGCVPDGRFLERVSIAADSAVLKDSDGILRPTDVGKNIAIPGATDLVAKIAKLIGDDRVALDDYARRTVTNLTINLGDRSISNGEMTIRGRTLISKTAGFSSADLDKTVTIKDAGLLVTTIQSFQSST